MIKAPGLRCLGRSKVKVKVIQQSRLCDDQSSWSSPKWTHLLLSFSNSSGKFFKICSELFQLFCSQINKQTNLRSNDLLT